LSVKEDQNIISWY